MKHRTLAHLVINDYRASNGGKFDRLVLFLFLVAAEVCTPHVRVHVHMIAMVTGEFKCSQFIIRHVSAGKLFRNSAHLRLNFTILPPKTFIVLSKFISAANFENLQLKLVFLYFTMCFNTLTWS